MTTQDAGCRTQGAGTNGTRAAFVAGLALLVASGAIAQTRTIDDFATVSRWTAAPSEGVSLRIAEDRGPGGPAMRLDFDFHGYSGWAAVRRAVDLDLPENYEFTFRIRGQAPVETLELKLVGASGDNVWWSVRRNFEFPRYWQTLRIRKRQVSFAWGPAGGGEAKHIAAIELAITAGSGGRGRVWISDLTLTSLPPEHPYAGTPVASASSALPGREPAQALTGEAGGWHSDGNQTGPQWLAVDFGERRGFGGLVINWDPAPGSFEVSTSDDGAAWKLVWQVKVTHGGRSFVPMPETDSRFVRLTLRNVPRGGAGVQRVDVKPLTFAETPNAFITSVTKDARRGRYPRGFLGEMASWTIVGDAQPTRPPALLGADGAFESAPRTFSLEPFVWLDGTLVTWADVTTQPELLDGYIPIPTVRWDRDTAALEITPLTDATGAGLWVRYRLTNRGTHRITPTLFLAARPFQVNPASQFLNTSGGVARLAAASCERDGVRLDGTRIRVLPPPARCGATGFDGGDVITFLDKGTVPASGRADSPYPSAALEWQPDLLPNGSTEVIVSFDGPAPSATLWHQQAAEDAMNWRRALGRATISGPPELEDFVRTVKSNLAYILESRDGPALQPGTRSYARSWIRDGAMMAAALLRLGHDQEVRAYLRWYARLQFENGRVPCCVDHRGADPVAENDSNGEFLFLAAEYLRYTGDAAPIAAIWPHIISAVDYLDRLRHEQRTDAYRAHEAPLFFGLLPASISHEGYSAKPMHSYWDDFWALAGLSDAVWLATKLDHDGEAAAWSAINDELRSDVLASIAAVRETKGLAYIPGCAELGDFDPTSTTVALWPAGIELPREALEATYDRYWHEVEARFTGNTAWDSYTPYEWRNVGALVRLGWRDRAVRLARWLMADRMPVGWNQWPEVVWHDRTHAHFLGDLPHAWVGADFIRSFLEMLAYERPADRALVLAASVPMEWVDGDGVAVRNLRTPYGSLSYSLHRERDGLRLRVSPGIRIPPGGLVVRPPLPAGTHLASTAATGHPAVARDEVLIHTLPADVLITAGPEKP
jgi:hypothetical protein